MCGEKLPMGFLIELFLYLRKLLIKVLSFNQYTAKKTTDNRNIEEKLGKFKIQNF